MRLSTMLAVTTALVSAAPLYAQTTSPTGAAPVDAQGSQRTDQGTPGNPQLDPAAPTDATASDIIVTARQREERLQDVPVAVTAISGDALRERQINQVRDIAAFTPGLNINSDSPTRAFVSIRGIGTTLIDTVQPGVGIFIDGVYQPNTSYLNSPIVDVARIEVLRGPQGTLFGNNTLGGAINVITRQPSNEVTGRVDAAYAGPDDYQSLSGSISGPIVEDVLQVRVGAAYHKQDGFQVNDITGKKNNFVDQKSVNGTIRFKPANGVQFTLNANHDYVKGAATPYFQVSGPQDYSLHGSLNADNPAVVEYTGVNLKGEFDVSPLKTIATAVIAYNLRTTHTTGDADFSPVDFFRADNRDRLITKTAELRLDTKWSDRFSTLVGGFLSDSHLTTNDITTIVPAALSVPADSTGTNKNAAIFGNIFYKLDNTLDLAAGLRYDHQSVNSSTATTAGVYEANNLQPRVSLTKRWSTDFMTYASVSRGVRGGGQNPPGSPNLIYRGDSVWTYEVGTKLSTPGNRASLNAAFFYNDYDDFIGQNAVVPSLNGGAPLAVNLNTGHVTSYGAEFEGSALVTDELRLYGNLTLLHARITNQDEFRQTTGYSVGSNRIIFTPDWNFLAGATYTAPVNNGSVAFDANVIGKGSRVGANLSTTASPVLASYLLTNGSITYRRGGFELALFGENLFNAKYIETYIDASVLARTGLPSFIAQNLAVQGNRRRVGVRAGFKF